MRKIDGKEWISAAQACAILGLPPRDRAIYRMIKSRVITCWCLPGCHPRLLRADVERIAQSMIVPADAPANT
jgi:hypothetical protein